MINNKEFADVLRSMIKDSINYYNEVGHTNYTYDENRIVLVVDNRYDRPMICVDCLDIEDKYVHTYKIDDSVLYDFLFYNPFGDDKDEILLKLALEEIENAKYNIVDRFLTYFSEVYDKLKGEEYENKTN